MLVVTWMTMLVVTWTMMLVVVVVAVAEIVTFMSIPIVIGVITWQVVNAFYVLFDQYKNKILIYK